MLSAGHPPRQAPSFPDPQAPFQSRLSPWQAAHSVLLGAAEHWPHGPSLFTAMG